MPCLNNNPSDKNLQQTFWQRGYTTNSQECTYIWAYKLYSWSCGHGSNVSVESLETLFWVSYRSRHHMSHLQPRYLSLPMDWLSTILITCWWYLTSHDRYQQQTVFIHGAECINYDAACTTPCVVFKYLIRQVIQIIDQRKPAECYPNITDKLNNAVIREAERVMIMLCRVCSEQMTSKTAFDAS